jgi:hypothetical protein
LIAVAARVGQARLIDNVVIDAGLKRTPEPAISGRKSE